MIKPIRIYFLCMQNRCRSQIAEAYAKHYGGPNIIVQSAGLEGEEVHPLTIEAMKEEGIDLSAHFSKKIDMKTFMGANVVVKLCEQLKERCPVVPFGIQNHQWNIPDPLPSGDIAEVRKARDAIKLKVLELLSTLNVLHADHGTAATTASTEEFAELFKLLGDRNRLTIVSLLKERELCVCELVELLQTSQPNISQHLRKLKDAGLLHESRKGQWVYYSLNMKDKPHLEPVLAILPSAKEKLLQLTSTNSCS
ncbi:metalloregulator ArsR/SmtB family transcription factor [Paenibacillus antri]|uniref:Metalloregulator ArsR/SmtB family transcription factor n=1 Tax=Paenibacillus antri TaxID=2582848 RepID=A0A5R9GCA8_9BACL|nr:metalloregulator ArsR/SmtB family transcription factor [Paenibacillus antri]